MNGLGDLLARPAIAPQGLRRIVGRLVGVFSVRRETLAIFCQVYLFIGDGRGPPCRLPPEVVTELPVARDMLVFVENDLAWLFIGKASCSDSSSHGYAVHCSAAAWKSWKFGKHLRILGILGHLVILGILAENSENSRNSTKSKKLGL